MSIPREVLQVQETTTLAAHESLRRLYIARGLARVAWTDATLFLADKTLVIESDPRSAMNVQMTPAYDDLSHYDNRLRIGAILSTFGFGQAEDLARAIEGFRLSFHQSPARHPGTTPPHVIYD